MEEDLQRLAAQAAELVDELEEEEDTEEGFEEFRRKKRDAERAIAQGTASEGLQAAMVALESLMVMTKLKEPVLMSRLREIIWCAKDASVAFEDVSDDKGRALALMALTRAHLTRAQEPDAPMAALKPAKEAVVVARGLEGQALTAETLCLLGEAHVAKAAASPFEKVVVEEIGHATKATREAEELFRLADDRRGMARAMHVTARALLRHTDEDEVLEGERFADEARELFHDLGERTSEVAVLLTGIAARQATSGPESALMMARDAAEDWQQEGGRPRDAALASLLAAGFQLELGEHADALKLCDDAQSLYDRSGSRRGVASVLETRAAVQFAMKRNGEGLNTLEEMAALYARLGDKRSQGNALLTAASMLLGQLSEEVESDTQAEHDKRDPKVGLSTEEVRKRSADGIEFANRASKCFEEAGYEEGGQVVTELIQSIYDRAIQIYCKTNEPDQIYYTLAADAPLEDKSKCIKEWKIPMPSASKTEGLAGGDGFLHVFDPHPPPNL